MHSTTNHNKKLDTIQVFVPCINIHAGSFANQIEFDHFVPLGASSDSYFTLAQFPFDSFILVNRSEPFAMAPGSLLNPSNPGEGEFVAGNVPASLLDWSCWSR